MDKGILFGVGVGPGDKELVTLKAVKILQSADIIAVPQTQNGETTAYNIIKDYVKNKNILYCNMPMTKNTGLLMQNYSKISDNIISKLNEGLNVAFITLGDPTVYSTYMQINAIVKNKGYTTQLVPGITSFCAAAARLNTPLCERDEPLIILPASYPVSDCLDIKGTKVLMKAGKSVLDVIDTLKQNGKADKAQMVECCGMENEKVYADLNDINEKTSYFSIIIVKE